MQVLAKQSSLVLTLVESFADECAVHRADNRERLVRVFARFIHARLLTRIVLLANVDGDGGEGVNRCLVCPLIRNFHRAWL